MLKKFSVKAYATVSCMAVMNVEAKDAADAIDVAKVLVARPEIAMLEWVPVRVLKCCEYAAEEVPTPTQ